jgi:pimeloyl-ACP methyl ester carboxylesterase
LDLHLTQQGQGPTLIFIHGVGGSSRIWDPIIPLLQDHFHVIRLDLLGYGHSPKPHLDFTPEVHTTYIRKALHQANIKPPYTLVGLSMGSLLALEYARHWPGEVQQILCIGLPYYTSEAAARNHLRHSFTARVTLRRGLAGRILLSTIWSIGRRHQRLAAPFSTLYTPIMAQESMMTSYATFRSTLTRCLLQNRPDPLLDATAAIPQAYLHGAADRYTSAAAVTTALAGRPNCTLTILPHTAHNTVILAPKDTVAWIQSRVISQISPS